MSLASVAAHPAWQCAGCRATLGQVVLDPTTPHVLLTMPQFTGRVHLPVTRLCGRCGTANYLGRDDLDRWRRRGGGRSMLSRWRQRPA